MSASAQRLIVNIKHPTNTRSSLGVQYIGGRLFHASLQTFQQLKQYKNKIDLPHRPFHKVHSDHGLVEYKYLPPRLIAKATPVHLKTRHT